MPILVSKNFKISKIIFILFSESYIAVRDVHISSEQAYVRILAYLKLLQMMYASVLRLDESEYVIKFCKTDVPVYAIFDGLIQL